MAQIPVYRGGQVQARGLAGPAQAPRATAEAFGAGRARDLYNFGGAVRQTGETVLEIHQIKQERIDRTAVRDMMTNLGNEYREWEKETLKTKRGMAAADLEKEGEQWFEERREAIASGLANQRQKDLFTPQFEQTRRGAVDALYRYSFQQVEAGERLSRDAQNDQFYRDCEVYALGNDDILREKRTLIHANIDANLVGQDEVVRAEARRQADQALYSRMAAAHAEKNPANAVKFLHREDVKEVFTPGELKTLREQYEAVAENAEITSLAISMAKAASTAEVGSDMVLEFAARKYADDPRKREQFMALYDDMRRRRDDGRKLEAAKAMSDLTRKFIEADFSLDAMTPDDRMAVLSDGKLFSAYSRHRKWLNKNKGISADHQWTYEMRQKQPSELREWLNQPKSEGEEFSNFEMLMRKTAGDKDLLNKVLSRSLEKDETGKAGSAKFNAAGFLETSYGDLYKTSRYIFWEAADNYQDADTNTAKSRRNGWLQFYDAALAEKEKELKRAANFEEQEDIAFRLANAVREGRIDLDKPYWSQRTGSPQSTGSGGIIAIDSLSFGERRFNRGEPVVFASPGAGAPEQNFGNIDPSNTRLLPPDIIDYKAKRVLRAYGPGSIGGREYEADDFIVYGQNNEIAFFAANGTLKGNPITNALPRDLESARVAAAEKEELGKIAGINEAEQNLNALLNRRRELEKSYETTFGAAIRKREERAARGEILPRSNQEDMARLHHQKRMDEINREIQDAENKLRQARGE